MYVLDYKIGTVCLHAKMCNVDSNCYTNSERDHHGPPHKEEVESQMYECPSFIIYFILKSVQGPDYTSHNTLPLHWIISTHPSLFYL